MTRPINKFTIPFNNFSLQGELAKIWTLRLTGALNSGMILHNYYIGSTYYSFVNNFALFSGTNGDPKQCWTSSDAINWSLAGNIPTEISSMAYGNGFFLFTVGSVGGAGIFKSTTGYSGFTSSNLATTFGGLVFTNGVFLAYDITNTRLVSSTDGVNWTVRAGGTGYGYKDTACYGNNTYLVVRGSNTYYTADNALSNFTGRSTPFGEILYTYFVNGFFYLFSVGNSATEVRTYKSSDAINWSHQSTINISNGFGGFRFGYGDGLFVIAINNNVNASILTYSSLDGVNWNLATQQPYLSSLYGAAWNSPEIAYGNKKFVMNGINVSQQFSIYTAKR